MKEDHTLHDTATEETPCTESIGKTVSTQQEPSYNAPDISNVIVHLPPIINQPVQFPVYPKQTEEQGDGVEADQSVESESDIPLFFNYHEFQETYYIEAGSIDQGAKEHDQEHALVITHFPNIYASLDSTEWETTRIVRISRAYDKRVNYPCFSEYIPGSEPAAIVNDTTKDKFVCQGKVPRDGQWYGYSSVSPLSLYFTPTQFQEIISKINQLIEEEYKIGSLTNIVDLSLGVFTLGLYTWIRSRSAIAKSSKLDDYIIQLNNSPDFKRCGVMLIPLTRSGYLSLDFQVPIPSVLGV